MNRPLAVHPDRPHVLYFEDGQGDAPHHLGIWNYETGEDVVRWPISQFENEDRAVFYTAAATPDLSRVLLVTASNLAGIRSMTMRAFDMSTGAIILTKGPASRLTPVGISPDGLTYVNQPDTLEISAVKDPIRATRSLPITTNSITTQIDSGGTEVLFDAPGNSLVLFDLETGKRLNEFVGTGSQIDAFTFSSDNQWIWSVDRGGEIRRWLRNTANQNRTTVQATMEPGATVSELLISQDSSKIFLLDELENLQVFDAKTLDLQWTQDNVRLLSQIGSEEVFVVTADFKFVSLDLETGERRREIPLFGNNVRVKAAVSSASGELTLALSNTNEIALWNLSENKLINSFSASELHSHAEHVLDLAITDSGLAISVDTLRRVVLWDARNGQEVKRLEGANLGSRLEMSSSEDHIAISTGPAPPVLLTFPGLEPVLEIGGGRRNGMDVAFHPTEPVVMSQFVQGSLNSINYKTGRRGAPLELPNHAASPFLSEVSEIAYSRDGSLLAAANSRGQIRVWRK